MSFRTNKKYDEFHGFMFLVYTYLSQNLGRLYITQAELDAYSDKITDFNNIYYRYTDQAQRTPVIITDTAERYAAAYGALRTIQNQIVNDARITLTPDDIAKLRLKLPPETRRRAERPTYAPRNELIENVSLTARILTFTLDAEGGRRTGIPHQHMQIERMLAMTDSEAHPKKSEYQSISFTTSARYTLTFTREQVHQYAHLITAYQTASGKRGPWSAPLTFRVNP